MDSATHRAVLEYLHKKRETDQAREPPMPERNDDPRRSAFFDGLPCLSVPGFSGACQGRRRLLPLEPVGGSEGPQEDSHEWRGRDQVALLRQVSQLLGPVFSARSAAGGLTSQGRGGGRSALRKQGSLRGGLSVDTSAAGSRNSSAPPPEARENFEGLVSSL